MITPEGVLSDFSEMGQDTYDRVQVQQYNGLGKKRTSTVKQGQEKSSKSAWDGDRWDENRGKEVSLSTWHVTSGLPDSAP